MVDGMSRFTRPEFAWPAAVVSLLLFGAGMTFAVLYFARSDGGAQVVGDYYRQGVAWDSVAAVRGRAIELGWRVQVTIAAQPGADGRRTVETTVIDSTGAGIEGLSLEIRLFSPSIDRPIVSTHAIDEGLGRYTTAFQIDRPGLWDIEVAGQTIEGPFNVRVRREIFG